MPKQLALGFTLPEKATLESYVPAANEQAVADITACAQGRGEPFIYLWGTAQTGKSHLLQAATQLADEVDRGALYIPLDQAKHFSPEIFDDLEQLNLICLDGVEQIAGDPAWERGLFNLFNRIQAQGNALLVSAQCSPLCLPIKLPDLRSRLSCGLCYQLHPLNDRQKVTALIEDASRRGLEMSEESARYILRHAPRDMGSLRQLLEALDLASLEAQRRLTVPFIRTILQRKPG